MARVVEGRHGGRSGALRTCAQLRVSRSEEGAGTLVQGSDEIGVEALGLRRTCLLPVVCAARGRRAAGPCCGLSFAPVHGPFQSGSCAAFARYRPIGFCLS